MKIIFRHIMKELFFKLLLVTSILAVILWFIPTFKLVNSFADNTNILLKIIPYSFLQVTNEVANSIPISFALASIIIINKYLNENNLDIISSAGVSRLSFASPFIFVALLVSMFQAAMLFYIAPISLYHLKTVEHGLRSEYISSFFQPGRFIQSKKGLVFNSKNKIGNHIEGIFIKDNSEKEETNIYYAKEGDIISIKGKIFLIMTDGNLVNYQNNNPKVSNNLSFSYYTINISELFSNDDDLSFKRFERTINYLLNPDKDDTIYKSNPNKYYKEIHRRIVLCTLPIFYVLIALFFLTKFSFKRQKSFIPNFIVFLLVILFWILMESVLNKITISNNVIYIYYSIPILFSLLTLYVINKPTTIISKYTKQIGL